MHMGHGLNYSYLVQEYSSRPAGEVVQEKHSKALAESQKLLTSFPETFSALS